MGHCSVKITLLALACVALQNLTGMGLPTARAQFESPQPATSSAPELPDFDPETPSDPIAASRPSAPQGPPGAPAPRWPCDRLDLPS